ncbi:hypothetical protein [Streptomyces avicenniae]|uniref:hypothetical protein n=1 Tax=Streptomyces avicenniae TaxID=500153 RepID=UPI00069AD878|nr:hypothetical protein [Streptomyces avicenniae]
MLIHLPTSHDHPGARPRICQTAHGDVTQVTADADGRGGSFHGGRDRKRQPRLLPAAFRFLGQALPVAERFIDNAADLSEVNKGIIGIDDSMDASMNRMDRGRPNVHGGSACGRRGGSPPPHG